MLLAISSSLHAVAITPAEPTGAVASLPRWRRPSLNLSQVGFRIALFEACSAFTSRYGLHLRQVAYQRPSTPKASTALLPPPLLRLLPAGATLTGRVSHPLKIAAFPRRTERTGLIPIPRKCHRGLINIAPHFQREPATGAGGEFYGKVKGIDSQVAVTICDRDELMLSVTARLNDDRSNQMGAREAGHLAFNQVSIRSLTVSTVALILSSKAG